MSAKELAHLEALRLTFGTAPARQKRALLRRLAGATFGNAATLTRYHEALAFIVAYPDDAATLALARAQLRDFAARADLARERDKLANSGIAGTAVHYRLFWMMAHRLARRLHGRLHLNWDEVADFGPRLKAALPLLLPPITAEAVERSDAPIKDIVDHLRGRQSDAAWLAARYEEIGDAFLREHLHDTVDAAYVLAPGSGYPSRSSAWHARAPRAWRKTPPPSGRPDLAAELKRPPRAVRRVGRAEGQALIDLAREAMLTRQRDLAAFSWGNADDVVMVDDGDGLAFAIIGSLPRHRLPLPAVHGWIMLRNRVPVGYVQTDTLLKGSELSFNVFETFRGVEAGHLFARVLAVTRHLFDARAFSIEPYQLGEGNDEGIASGAWWFYYKLGFRPIADGPKRVLASELKRMARNPAHRSSAATLMRLARGHMVWEPEAGRRAWLPLVPALGLGLRMARGPTALEDALRRANARFGVGSTKRWSVDERAAWANMAPLALALPGVRRWGVDERRAAIDALKCKGAKSESAFLRRVDAHPQLTRSMQALLAAQG